jgi:hypothetical protein
MVFGLARSDTGFPSFSDRAVSIMKRAFQRFLSFVAAGVLLVVILRDIRRSRRRRTAQA